MPFRRWLRVALVALGVGLSCAHIGAQQTLAPFPPARRFNPVPQLQLPPLHISGETRIRLRNASFDSRALAVERLFQAPPPAPSRSPDRIRRAVITLTALAASAMVLLLVAGWLFLRRRRS